MNLLDAVCRMPDIPIFRVTDSDSDDQSGWLVEPIDTQILKESDGHFVLKAKNVLANGSVLDCYIDMSLPERVHDYAFFVEANSLKVGYSGDFDGDIICAVPIECFGNYDLFFSKVHPEIGIQILRDGLNSSGNKSSIAEDLGYILRDAGRYKEAAEAFRISADNSPSSYFIFGELAQCYGRIGDRQNADKFQLLYDKENENS